MDKVVMYLRKSRADEEAEKRGEGETLSKHKKILLKVAKEMNLNIVRIRKEIVSGESIIHRPEMLELLKEVENGVYDAVLCMDLDRLGRGNMQEQGLILETFKKSNTKIITPRKTYDLHDEFDEEYSEFEAFMARKELKIINRRLQRGRIRSIEDGNYISPNPPYGYEIYEDANCRTLVPHPEQALVVKMIFDLYVNQSMGGNKIANKLNELGYKTQTGRKWLGHSVINIIKNEVYTGKVTWKKTKSIKSSKEDQNKEVERLPRNEWIVANGKHEALISEALFRKAQDILKGKYHVPYNTRVTNPLAGILKCKVCGGNMVYRTYLKSEPHVMCYANCGNKSSKFKYVEQRIIESLNSWLEDYKAQWEERKPNKNENKRNNPSLEAYRKALSNLENELQELSKQKDRLHDLLERGIYDVDTYLERSQNIAQRIDDTEKAIKNAKVEIENENRKISARKEIIPYVERVLDLYYKTSSAEKKNKLLKSVLEKVEYVKRKDERNDEFTIFLYPRLPKENPYR
ncbi:MAG: recombinase family protein [Firmicutes bacterium]|nr:recombinase family protein [Bacillota bacterium]